MRCHPDDAYAAVSRYNLPEGAIVLVSALGGPADDAAAAAADAADADDQAALAAELADAAAAEGTAPKAASQQEPAADALGLDVKPYVAPEPALDDAVPGLDDTREPAEVAREVKQEADALPPGASAEVVTSACAEGTDSRGEPGQQEAPQPSAQEAAVKPDLDQLDAAHDAVVAAAADGNTAGVVASAQREAAALDAARAQAADPQPGPRPGPAPGSVSPVAPDDQSVKDELMENAEASDPQPVPGTGPTSASAPAAAGGDAPLVKEELIEAAEASVPSGDGGARTGPAGAAGRRVKKKRTRWGNDPDESADQTDAGESPTRSVKVKVEPR